MRQSEMEQRAEASSILRKLALGLDPQSGRPLREQHVLNRPENIRALMVAVEALKPLLMTGNATDKLPPRAGSPWSGVEDDELRALFSQRHTLRQIAAAFLRTPGAIASRLVRLGLVQSRDEASRMSDQT